MFGGSPDRRWALFRAIVVDGDASAPPANTGDHRPSCDAGSLGLRGQGDGFRARTNIDGGVEQPGSDATINRDCLMINTYHVSSTSPGLPGFPLRVYGS